jgi:hypothetical protein
VAYLKRYFSVQYDFMRELFDIKFNSRSRKDLDEISEKTGISLVSCRRQVTNPLYIEFGNAKRIMKKVEDLNGNLRQEIVKTFLLSTDLALAYATVIFISIHKMETAKKKLGLLKFQTYTEMISAILDYWTSTSDQAEFDLTLAQDLKDMKNCLFGSREVVDEFVGLLNRNLAAPLNEKVTPTFLKNFLRDVIDIGMGFSNPKEVKLLFVNILEELAEPCIQMNLNTKEVSTLLDTCCSQFYSLEKNNPNLFGKKSLYPSLQRMVQGISTCLTRLLDD